MVLRFASTVAGERPAAPKKARTPARAAAITRGADAIPFAIGPTQ
jgi:hypothetical protein